MCHVDSMTIIAIQCDSLCIRNCWFLKTGLVDHIGVLQTPIGFNFGHRTTTTTLTPCFRPYYNYNSNSLFQTAWSFFKCHERQEFPLTKRTICTLPIAIFDRSWVSFFDHYWSTSTFSVADPGFPVQEAPTSWGWGANSRHGNVSAIWYVKTKESGPLGAGSSVNDFSKR